jgi:FkbM family methyltransferase
MAFVSYAQNFEDVMLWRALKHVERGFYIDVGAADATVDSVTRAFYDRGWRGINIEPVPALFRKLAAERPEDVNLQVAVGDKTGEATFFAVCGEGLSTLMPEVANAARDRGFRLQELRVRVRTLAEICKSQARGQIHFLKVDVEGAEWGVLAGADFTLFRPWIVVVEATYPMTEINTYSEWEPLLFSAGYRFVWFDGVNRFYVAEEKFADLGAQFTRPVNFFDDFIRFDAVSENRIATLTKESHEYAEQLAQTKDFIGKIQEKIEELQRKETALHESKAKLRDTEVELARTQAELVRTQAALDVVHASVSWRMTAPLRRFYRLIRSLSER